MKKVNYILFYILLIIFTIYIILDTFVIKKEIKKVDNPSSTSNMNKGNVKITNNTYEDDNIKITLDEYYENSTKIYVADININNSKLLKTAFANNTYGKNITKKTSEISEDLNAILTINGDYYGVQEKGYVIKNGILYRSQSRTNQEDLVIYEDGSFEIINEDDISASELLSKGVYNLLSFGPSLLQDGKISISKNYEVAKAMNSNPRTAIGIIDQNHYVFVVSDGRTNESEGLSLYELAEFMQKLNVKTAYNLDGGGSSTMVFNGEIINNPTTNGNKISERSVSDVVYIGY